MINAGPDINAIPHTWLAVAAISLAIQSSLISPRDGEATYFKGFYIELTGEQLLHWTKHKSNYLSFIINSYNTLFLR